MTDDQQRARALASRLDTTATAYGMLGEKELPTLLREAAAALRAAPEAVALRVAMQSLEQIANAPDDQGAKFNAMGALRFLQTQPVELRATPVCPEGFVMVPVEPTREMLKEIHLIDAFTYEALCKRYAAMLAARPQGVK